MTASAPVELVCHPSAPSGKAIGVKVNVACGSDNILRLNYALDGELSGIRLPEARATAGDDGLWKHTCFEAFMRSEGTTAYHEFNFAPSGAWAIYRFSAYREGRVAFTPARAPRIETRKVDERLMLDATVPLDEILTRAGTCQVRVALAAVIEAMDGTLSYWALRHAPGKPDFHHADSFAMTLP